jgi:hypothetical protein
MSAPNSLIADVEPPAERRDLTYADTCTERGKPIGLPRPSTEAQTEKAGRARESEPQGKPMGLWAEDGGKSESLPVMGRIGIELEECSVRANEEVHHPTRKRADFQTWSLVTR